MNSYSSKKIWKNILRKTSHAWVMSTLHKFLYILESLLCCIKIRSTCVSKALNHVTSFFQPLGNKCWYQNRFRNMDPSIDFHWRPMFLNKLDEKRWKRKLNILIVVHQNFIKNRVAGYVTRFSGTFMKLLYMLLQELWRKQASIKSNDF